MNYKKPTKAIITDAGFASRYLPITKTVPKAMLPLGNKPIMQLVVEECAEAGIEEIIIVAIDQVLNFPKITVIEQDPAYPYGNGSPIASARKFINDDEAFVVAYSDDVVFGSSDMKTLIDSYEKHPEAKAIIIAQEMPKEVLNKYGIIKLSDSKKMLLDNIVEKPAIEKAPSNLTSYGRYLLTPEVFAYLDPKNTGLDGELWTVDAITKMAESGDVVVEKTQGYWMTTGDPKNYLFALLEYTFRTESFGDELKEFVKNA